MELMQLNKFGDLHNGRSVIFCKTEFLKAEFKRIGKLKNEVVLISGNNDEGVDATYTRHMPDNVRTWYCQNNLTYDERLKSLPLGLENTFENKRKGHGVGWPHAIEKIELLNELQYSGNDRAPAKLLYANFNVQTNSKHRIPVRDLCEKSNFIDWEEPVLKYPEFLRTVLDYQAVLCPAGNGVDTHRIYEILYCGRIPVTIKRGDYPLYREIYEKLPVVMLEQLSDLNDRNKIEELIDHAKRKLGQFELLDFRFWKQSILTESGTVPKVAMTFLEKLISHFR